MPEAFTADRFRQEPFDDRLRAVLQDACRTLGADAVAIVERTAASGALEPGWRCVVPPIAVPDLPVDLRFDAGSVGGLGIASGAGGPFEHALVVPIPVSPPLSHDGDALLLVAGGSPDPAVLAEVVGCLAAGLSADRRDRLARAVFEAVVQAPDPMEVTDSDARVLFANEAWQRLFGHHMPYVAGRTVGSLFRDQEKPVHDPAFYQFTLASLDAGRAWLGALGCRTGEGKRVFCEVHVAPFEASAHGFRGNFAVRRDLTHRAARDAALAVAHQEFRSVLSAMPEGVVVVRNGSVYFANAAFLGMVRSDETSVIGQSYLDFIHPDDRVAFEQKSTNGVVRVRVMVAEQRYARIAEVSMVGSVSFEGRPAMIMVSRDVTDHLIAQEQLARAEKLSALGSLAAGVAHEINNPLSYVILNLEHVQERADALDPAALESLREGVDGAKRIHRIVKELHGFSGTDGPGPSEPVDISKAFSSAVNIAHNEIRHRARLERHHEEGVFAMAREGQVVQVLVNLLVNAAQAIPESQGPHVIGVSSRVRAGVVEMVVSDTGTGISDALLPRLFEPFTTSKPRGRGTGLGLAIAKRIVEGFGGTIAVATTLGKGTVFTVRLPAARTMVTPQPSKPRVMRKDLPRASVLIIDDEPPLARALKRILAGHHVVAVHDGREALDLITAKPVGSNALFDLILCDLMMPGLPGPELYHEVCRLRPDLAGRFVFMTGGAFTDSGAAFLETMGSRVLVKPFDAGQLLRWVEQAATGALRH